MRNYLIMLLLLPLACGCGAGVDNAPDAPPAPAVPPAAFRPAQLPPFPGAELPAAAPPGLSARQTSSGELYWIFFGGDRYHSASANAFTDNGGMVLPPGGGQLEWVVYQAYNAGAECDELQLDLTILGGNCWVAFADYSTGMWELHGPYDTTPTDFDLDQARYFSPVGAQWFAILAYDSAQVTVNHYKPRVEPGQTIEHDVAEPGAATALDMDVLNGKPTLAFVDSVNASLRCARATTATPGNSSNWVFSTVFNAAAPQLSGLDLEIVAGKPVIAFIRSDTNALELAYSTSSTPDDAGDWHSVTIDGSHVCHGPSLCLIGGRLQVAYFEADVFDGDVDLVFGYTRYAIADSADYTGAWTSYRLADNGMGYATPSLEDGGGRPALAYADTTNFANPTLLYGTATQAVPETPPDWGTFHSPLGAPNPLTVKLRFSSTASVISYLRQADGVLEFQRATVADPQQPSDWVITNQLPVANLSYDLLLINDLPVWSFVYDDTINLVRRLTTFRMFWFDFDPFGYVGPSYSVSTPGQYNSVGLTRVNDQPVMAYYDDMNGGTAVIRYWRLAYD